MPYIKEEKRQQIMSLTDQNILENAGELNFTITMLIQEYVLNHGLKYQTLNDVSGALTECLAEFRRRVISPYEDTKIKENGDCYEIEVFRSAKIDLGGC